MEKILILYEHPKAINDISRWAKDHNVHLDFSKAYHSFYLDGDYISIAPIEFAFNYVTCSCINKLVIFGELSNDDIINISGIRLEEVK